MIAELFTNNALNLVIIFGSCAALILMSFWFRRGNRKRKGFLFHAVQFLIYTIIISAVGSIINYVIENYKLKFITPGVIDFICTSLIAVILTIKLFLLINQFEKQQIKKGRDITSARIMSRIIKITIIVVLVLLYGEHFGMSLSGLLTFGGIGGLAVGMAGKDILSNFFSGIMLYFDRPFSIGDWIDLQNGRIDGVFGDTAVVTEWLKDNPKLAAVGDKVTDKDYFGTGLGIAVRQGNTELQQKLNTALEKVKKDGTYETIYNKWFQK